MIAMSPTLSRTIPGFGWGALGLEGPRLKFQLNGGMEVEYGVRMRPAT